MKIIYFRLDREVIYFCEMLYQFNEKIEVQWKRDKYWGNELRINNNDVTLHQIISCFVEVFLHHRLQEMIKKIARENYYYTDQDEIERITLLSEWLIFEKNYQQKLFGEHKNLATFIFNMIKKNIHQLYPIHFDSLVTFSLQPISECLQKAVGFGIDELKREEEYQSFVHSVRHYIMNRKTKTDTLHIVQGDNFCFYNAYGEKFTNAKLKKLMIKEPLYLIGLDENEFNISPVITLLPKNIFVYGDHPSEAKTLALINLFEERVKLLPLNQFPFELK